MHQIWTYEVADNLKAAATEIKRLREENRQLKTEIAELKHDIERHIAALAYAEENRTEAT